MQRNNVDVLISGAGVAGPILAFWLRRYGFRPVVVERDPALRHGSGGHAVDLCGPAVGVVDRMGLRRAVRASRTRADRLVLERPGRRPIEIDMSTLPAGISGNGHVEIARGDLVRILHGGTRDDVEYVFGDSVETIQQDDDGVHVTFDHGEPRRFDLVVGADGLHSNVRRLTFGAEHLFTHYLGGYLAAFTFPDHRVLGRRVLRSSSVDKLVTMYPVRQAGQARAVFLFRADDLCYDHRDTAQQKRLLREVFAGQEWEVPRLLTEMENASDFYLESITQVRMGTWSRGRVTLVGDSGYAAGSAVGGGTTVAAVGAYVLAGELARSPGDHRAAFAAYQDAMRDYVAGSCRIGPTVLTSTVPRSRFDIERTAVLTRMLPRLPMMARKRILGADTRLRDSLAAIRLADYQPVASAIAAEP